MFLRSSIVAIILATVPAAMAACPPAVPMGTSAEAIEVNSRRLLCLQQELAAQTEQRKFELELDSLERSLDQLELKQRLNTIAPPQPVLFP